jgi:ATP-dependent DNA helicase RecG
MNLPINIEDLLHGKAIEWERLEFKKGWNPEAVLHTLCAFANDFHNLGGGYLIIGVEANDGQPKLPPAGISAKELDKIQKEIVELGHRTQPFYHPIVSPYQVEGKFILVLWAPGGPARPYKAPVSLSKTSREYSYFIRKASVTVKAKGSDETELLSLTARVPFDDRVNQQATLEDLSLPLIKDFLKAVGSQLRNEAGRMEDTLLFKQMNIISGPPEFLLPLNAGLMFFNEHPEKFFPQAQIDVVQFPDGPGGDVFTEKIFTGPLNKTLKDALAYIKSILIEETVVKHPDRAEAERFYNYPFIALEEALVNAVYHRDYEIREPIEVRILPDCVAIVSYPGPDRSIKMEAFKSGHFFTHRYRNRRIGEFLKELEFTEGRGTGIPKILGAMKRNGSPKPQFETDEDRSYFVAKFPIHPKAGAAAKKSTARVEPEWSQSGARVEPELLEMRIMKILTGHEASKSGISKELGQKTISGPLNRILKNLVEIQCVELTIPNKPNSRLQRYMLTEKGRKRLESDS